ncbi:class V lanthionine synthetase subunit LxmK [Nocardioides pantholopis]|uniref:class V lanthionine synthetase subunit LxmK n=1 Tax=Nocardioides pantholopis TaxID=2483798 RepID=UPI000F076191|nr:class V lanthionine synthetase subunit LxmK [Nocardioides pantholopis]
MRIDPRLDGFLEQHGLGRLRPETAKEQLGRNSNFLVVTTTGRQLFVKRIRMRGGDSLERFRACAAFDALRCSDAEVREQLRTAPLVAADEELGFLAYEAVPGAESLALLAGDQENRIAEEHGAELGSILAAVHRLSADRVPERENEPVMPPVAWLDVLPWPVYQGSSAPALQIWHRLQSDTEVRSALARLRADEKAARQCAVHGDVRLDQFLVGSDGVLRLVDLEEFRRGDAARDVGAMVGEWLHRATLDLLGDRDTDPAAALGEVDLDHEDVVASGVAALERRRPAVTRFWNAYRAAGGGSDDPAFLDRVTRFAGWHMFDRLIAAAENASRISALHWGAAGIGRQALLHPRAAAPALGLPATTDHTALEEDAA